MNGTRALIKRDPRGPAGPSHHERLQGRKLSLRKWAFTRHQIQQHHNAGLQASTIVRKKRACALFVTASQWTKTSPAPLLRACSLEIPTSYLRIYIENVQCSILFNNEKSGATEMPNR